MDPMSDEGKLFIGGIGWETTEDKLKDHFSRYGDVTHATIMRDRVTSNPRGFGFVVFSDPSVIPDVIRQSHNIDGRTVEAKRAISREQQQTLKAGNSSTGGTFGGSENLKTKKIFVGGLPSTLTEDEFKEYFQDYGYITDIVIMYDPNTGRPRGFGFITFTTEDAVDRILQKTFHELNGKQVEVKRALPKDAVMGGGARGYRGYNSYSPSGRALMGTNRFIQPNLPTGLGAFPPYSGYGASSYGYLGNSSLGYTAFGGYGVGGYGSGNAGFSAGSVGLYGSPDSPNTNFSRSQWRAPLGGYGVSGYCQTTGYGASFSGKGASRSGVSGYAPGARSPSGSSRYVNKGYNNNFGGTDTSNANAGGSSGGGGGGAGHSGASFTGGTYDRTYGSSGNLEASWKSES